MKTFIHRIFDQNFVEITKLPLTNAAVTLG